MLRSNEIVEGPVSIDVRSPRALAVRSTARRCLRGVAVNVANVVNFPDGGSDSARVERETRRALGAGANEIDLVLPYRALLAGDAAHFRIGASALSGELAGMASTLP